MYKNGIPAEYLRRQAQALSPNYRMQNHEMNDDQQTELAKLKQELAEARERYLRLAADFDNHRKRTARDMYERVASQKVAVVRDLLPAIDNLERALTAHSSENLREGIQMIYKQLLETLKRHGFEPRDDFGEPFDGRFHDALAVGCKQELPDSSVIEVWERGWMRGTEMFRPAKVLVNKLESEGSPTEVREPVLT